MLSFERDGHDHRTAYRRRAVLLIAPKAMTFDLSVGDGYTHNLGARLVADRNDCPLSEKAQRYVRGQVRLRARRMTISSGHCSIGDMFGFGTSSFIRMAGLTQSSSSPARLGGVGQTDKDQFWAVSQPGRWGVAAYVKRLDQPRIRTPDMVDMRLQLGIVV